MKLPIEVVPNTDPPVFRWRQTVSTPIGTKTVDHLGRLPPAVEQTIVLLIDVARQLAKENAILQGSLESANKRLEEQDAEPPPVAPKPAPVTPKKGK